MFGVLFLFFIFRTTFTRFLLTEANFSIASDYEQVSEVNKLIRVFLLKENLEMLICNAVEICLNEALNNVIKHAYGGKSKYGIDINIRKNVKYLEIEIIDNGESRAKLDTPTLDFDPEDIDNLPESGMGLYIIHQLMDEVNYITLNGKNYFTLKKYLD
jgi:serine/threonine-protein kinase RsbW